jgi:hypothetical protein
MAARARFSIALLMAVVFFVAADFAIADASSSWPGPSFALAVTTLPTINLLFLALPRLRRREARPFWLGFEVVGWLTVFLAVWLGRSHQLAFFSPIIWIDRHDFFGTSWDSELPFLIAIAAVLYTIPPVLAASVGGWLSARCQIAHRRPSATVEEV